jgi:hypothetical protein
MPHTEDCKEVCQHPVHCLYQDLRSLLRWHRLLSFTFLQCNKGRFIVDRKVGTLSPKGYCYIYR